MQTLKVANLKSGATYSQPLFSASGQKLLNAGVALSDRQIAAILRAGELEVYLADSTGELQDVGILNQASANDLREGVEAQTDVLSEGGNVLVEAGEQIERHHLDAIAASGGAYVPARVRATKRRERILLTEALVEDLDTRVKHMDLRVRSLAVCDWLDPQDADEWPAIDELQWYRGQHVEKLHALYAKIEAGVRVQVGSLDPLLDDMVGFVKHHHTRVAQLALLVPRKEDYLPDHAYTVAILAMATATRLRWPPENVREIGLTGLLFDLGMLLVPQRVRATEKKIGDVDRSRIQQHPLFSLAMMQSIETVPTMVQLAAMQHHERENGSGYTRGVRKDAICDYARVIAVTDTFAATTEPRHYRKPKLPYIAMEELLRAASGMVYWTPAVRALIQAAGLFPVGSYVRLSDRRNAHVIAANPDQIDRPVIQPLDDEGNPDGPTVDLSAPSAKDLAVARPVASAKG